MKLHPLSLATAILWGWVVTPAIAQTQPVWFGTGAKGIYHATLNTANGEISDAQLAAEIASPGFLDLHPDGNKLYAVCRLPNGNPGVAGFAIQDGSLRFLNGKEIGDGGGTHLAVHPSGTFLLTAQYGGGSTARFGLDGDGHLQGEPILYEHEGGSKVVAKRQKSPHPHWCGFDLAAKFAFVPDLGMDGVVIYRIADQQLHKHGFAEVPAGGGPRHMKFSHDGKRAYVLNELALSVSVFDYNAPQGSLTMIQTIPTLTEAIKDKESFNAASEIRIHPNGQFAYAANRGHDSITVFAIEAESGKLRWVENEPIRGAWPRNFNLDPSGRWLLAAGGQSNTVSVFAVDTESGELTFQRGKVINVPSPICVLFSPSP